MTAVDVLSAALHFDPARRLMLDAIKGNPVRLYGIAAAALALAVVYVPALPVPAILGLVAALLGMGETVRARVSPSSKVLVHKDDLAPGEVPVIMQYEDLQDIAAETAVLEAEAASDPFEHGA